VNLSNHLALPFPQAEGLSLQIERLEREMEYAIDNEDYVTAARLRDQLK
jgi:protein-arginine kinase activator protein McsA